MDDPGMLQGATDEKRMHGLDAEGGCRDLSAAREGLVCGVCATGSIFPNRTNRSRKANRESLYSLWEMVSMTHKHKKLTFMVPLERGLQRFRELVVYISKKCDSDYNYGAVKLNKILYHSDFKAFERFGVPLTGVLYFKLKAGPAPKVMLPVRRALINEGAIRVEKVHVGPYEQHRIIALRDPVMQYFAADEVALVDEVISELWPQNATEVSDASHDVRWRTLNIEDSMPYEFAFLSDEAPTEADVHRFEELNRQYNWE